ncbi:hypothetical protein EDD16DRAFT_1629058 [Pisolithus croceorrhizus]|nr:hypothetical protein EDD16DRAFT_1629058 [Pisolithus croceorrhizus]
MMEASPVSNVPSVGAAEGWSVIPCSSENDIVALEDGSRVRPPKLSCANSAMRRNLFQGGWQFTAAKSDPRLEVVLPLLNRRLEALYGMFHLPSWAACVDERQRVEDEMKSILQTLGVNLLEHIRITVYNAYREHTTWPGGPIISSFRASSCPSTEAAHRVTRLKYDRQLNIPSMVQDIMALQATLDATKNEDEQRTLEEDATGKILWLFLCGICAEVDELLPKVVGYIQERRNMMGLHRLYQVTPSAELGDDQAQLQRIMYDAGTNTSKYQLWLDARARGQTKWSATNRGISTTINQGTAPNTSRQTPPTSEVHTAAASLSPQTPTRKRKLSESRSTDAGADDEVANWNTWRLRRLA